MAHQRPWHGDDSRSVTQVFEEEKPRLLPFPAHPFSADLMRPVRAHKPSASASIAMIIPCRLRPWGRALTLVASPITVRLLDASTEIASHHRSFDRHQLVEDPARRQVLF